MAIKIEKVDVWAGNISDEAGRWLSRWNRWWLRVPISRSSSRGVDRIFRVAVWFFWAAFGERSK